MDRLRTSDGFEFETVREDDAVRCVCRRDGKESSVTVRYGAETGPHSVPTEPLELIARNAWLAGQGLRPGGGGAAPGGQ